MQGRHCRFTHPLMYSDTWPPHSSLSTSFPSILFPQNDGIHLPGADEAFANPLQHAVVALIVLGAAMATAIWVPNVEFIFGE